MNLHIVSLIVGVGFQWKSDTSEPLWLFMSSASLKISLHNMCTANSVTSVLVSRFFKYKAIPELFWVFLWFYLSVWNVLINLWCYQTPKNSSIAVFLPSFLARWVLGGAGHYVRFKKPFIECIISSWSPPSWLEISYWFFCFFQGNVFCFRCKAA